MVLFGIARHSTCLLGIRSWPGICGGRTRKNSRFEVRSNMTAAAEMLWTLLLGELETNSDSPSSISSSQVQGVFCDEEWFYFYYFPGSLVNPGAK